MTARGPAEKALLGASLVVAIAIGCRSSDAPSIAPNHPPVGCPAAPGPGPFAPPPTGLAIPQFHRTSSRLGWLDSEPELTRAAVGAPTFGPRWSSPRLDEVRFGSTIYAPHVYASPLYLDDVAFAGDGCDGLTLSAVFVATSNGYVYAIAAFDSTVNGRSVAAGTILWSQSLGPPSVVTKLDGGMPLGILSTPVIDRTASRLYVTSLDEFGDWRAWALDLGSGAVVSGWPVTIDASSVEPVNTNGPAPFAGGLVLSQRSALSLSPAGDRLYVPFGGYFDGAVGWMVVIETTTTRVVTSFSGEPAAGGLSNGGVWSAGGPALDDAGRLYATIGNTPSGLGSAPHVWGESLLAFAPSTFALDGTYTPFNHCALDDSDADIGGSSPIVLPDLSATGTTTPRLVAFGGKQGNVYLVDRDHMPGALDARPACSTDSTTDRSLLPPDAQPQFNARGPLSVFTPYTESFNNLDYAKMRSTPAYFADATGAYLFVSGSSKAAVDSVVSVAPSIARLRVVTPQGAPAYLAIDARDTGIVFQNPGSPVVTSHGPDDAIVWVLDENAPRGASLVDPNVPHPVLYAIDAASLRVLWQSTDLEVAGKYSTVAAAHGRVFVGTDRLRVFGPR